MSVKELSARQLAICYHLIEGCSNYQIQKKLHICRETVKWHLALIYKVYDMKYDRSAAIKRRKELIQKIKGELCIVVNTEFDRLSSYNRDAQNLPQGRSHLR
jgi:DNA-binding CsgD family transcriptional regulator